MAGTNLQEGGVAPESTPILGPSPVGIKTAVEVVDDFQPRPRRWHWAPVVVVTTILVAFIAASLTMAGTARRDATSKPLQPFQHREGAEDWSSRANIRGATVLASVVTDAGAPLELVEAAAPDPAPAADPAQCGAAIEVGSDYTDASGWGLHIDGSPSVESCCASCEETPKCQSWTWIEDASLKRQPPSQCWLRGGPPSGKTSRVGCTSGLPKARAPGAENASAAASAEEEGLTCTATENDIDYRDDSGWGIHIDGMPTAEECCAECGRTAQCKCWSWVKDAGLKTEVPSQCWLKGGPPTKKVKQFATVSGLSPKATEEEIANLKNLLMEDPATSVPKKVKREDGLPKLLCWAVMRDHHEDEVLLMSEQASRGVGIFACDDYYVFSSVDMELADGIRTTKIDIAIEVEKGQEWAMTHSWLNTEVFIKAWGVLSDLKTFWDNDWMIKVDPDTVLITEPLRQRLGAEDLKAADSLWIKNCDRNEPPGFGLYGSVEILSRNATGAFMWGLENCQEEMNWKGQDFGWHGWGEDYFLWKCLDRMRIPFKEDFGIVKDENCFKPPQPCNTGQFAYHPLKSRGDFLQCLEDAQGYFGAHSL